MRSICGLLVGLLIGVSVQAELKIVKAKAQPAIRKIASDEQALKATFLDFLSCGQDKRKLHGCMAKFLKAPVRSTILRYDFIFRSPLEISEPFVCTEENERWVRKMEQEKFEQVLCFEFDQGNVGIGYVFFDRVNGQFKISKIKM